MISTILILQSLLTVCSQDEVPLRSGAERLDYYLPLLEGKHIGLVANHISVGDDLVKSIIFNDSNSNEYEFKYQIKCPEFLRCNCCWYGNKWGLGSKRANSKRLEDPGC